MDNSYLATNLGPGENKGPVKKTNHSIRSRLMKYSLNILILQIHTRSVAEGNVEILIKGNKCLKALD